MERVLEGIDSRWPVISIEGMGGVGKTTLAIEAAHRCLPGSHLSIHQPFDAVAWISAKARPEQKLWLNEIIDTIARLLDYLYITQLPSEQKKGEIDKLLRSYRVLVIVDNFETIEDTDLEYWIQMVPEPSKILITSRHTQLRSVWPIHLRGLEESQAITLLRRHAQRLGLQTLEKASDTTILPLVDVTEGNPKAIEMAIGHVKYSSLSLGMIVDHLHHAHHTVNDIFTYLFTHTWSALTEDAKLLLLVTPFFRETASKEALGAAADLTGYRLDRAATQLVEMSMLDIRDEQEKMRVLYSTHPLIRSFATNQRREVPTWEPQARQRWLAWYLDFTTSHDSINEDRAAFAALDEEYENIVAVLEWTLAQDHASSFTLMQKVWYYLYIRGYWQQCEKYLRQTLELVSVDDSALTRLDLASRLGWLLTEKEGPEQEAIKWLHRVEEEIIALQQPVWLEATLVLNYLGQAYLTQGDLDQAEVYQNHFLALAQQVGNRRHTVSARYYLAFIQFRRGQLEQAQHTYRESLVEAQNIHWERAEGYCSYRLAITLIELAQLEEAEQWLDHAELIANHWHEPLLHTHVLLGRAHLLRKQQHLQEALRFALSALDFYRRLGSRDQRYAAGLIADLEKALAQ